MLGTNCSQHSCHPTAAAQLRALAEVFRGPAHSTCMTGVIAKARSSQTMDNFSIAAL
jgi:hypothetical protein